MGRRRKSRELAIQILYQIEMSGTDAEQGLQIFWENNPHSDTITQFTSHVVQGTLKHRKKIDKAIRETATNWAFTRITHVDRAILREAVFEIFYCPDIPYKVTLNEAIELGKKFGSEKSGAFLNGVLDNLRTRHADKINN